MNFPDPIAEAWGYPQQRSRDDLDVEECAWAQENVYEEEYEEDERLRRRGE